MYRQSTPPSAAYPYAGESHSQLSPGSSYYSYGTSPGSTSTSMTTPPRSPIRHYGAVLLPRVRAQDQTTEPGIGPVRRHSRALSTASAGGYGYASSMAPSAASRPRLSRRAPSPPSQCDLLSPVSAVSAVSGSYDHSDLNSPISFSAPRQALGHMRSVSASAVPSLSSHRRSGSASSIDESVIGRYGYPTYRQMPAYVTASSTSPGVAPPVLNVVTALPYSYTQPTPQYTPQTIGSQDYSYADFSPAPAVQNPYTAPSSAELTSYNDCAPTTTILDYLSSPNPSPSLVRRIAGVTRGTHSHFWWDVRNMRRWTDFSIETISAIPGLLPLLEIPVSGTSLPAPPRTNLQPETEAALQGICFEHYATKVNAALRVAQGDSHMVMRACRSSTGSNSRVIPDFVSNYQSDYEKTIFGDGRGRVVGLVKAYDSWNTGMRSEGPNKQVHYLQGLSHLQRAMREHGCRYGFIMTEIELLCVRCGGPPDAAVVDPTTVNSTSGVPVFGYLEVSAPIPLSTQGVDLQTGTPRMTAGMALWFLHMLAKEAPLPGMGGWRMDVGGPAALTRQNCLARDSWMPPPTQSDKREARRVRGWIWPEEPLNRKECGRGKRKAKA